MSGVCQHKGGDARDGRVTKEQESAERYRVRAEELRVIAEMDRNEETRQILLGIARDYEKMAISMDKIEATNRLLGKSQISN